MKNILSSFPLYSPVFILVLIIISLIIIPKIIRTAFRLFFIAAFAGFIIIGFFGHSPKDTVNSGENLLSQSKSYFQDKLEPVFQNSLKNVHVKKRSNGAVELVGDQLEIGETSQGKYVFHILSLNLSFSKDELSKYLEDDALQKGMPFIHWECK